MDDAALEELRAAVVALLDAIDRGVLTVDEVVETIDACVVHDWFTADEACAALDDAAQTKE